MHTRDDIAKNFEISGLCYSISDDPKCEHSPGNIDGSFTPFDIGEASI